jgi:hypothetical protein
MYNRFYFFMLMACLIAAGCAQQAPKPPATATVSAKPVMMEPFRFHKLIEVSPGNDFDVVSWGRGSKDIGAFAILHSDSAGIKYTTTTGDLEGSIVDVYNSDMDLDGNPEILIQAKAKDTSNYAVIYAFEFTDGKANKLDFPKLTKTQRKGYRGDDNFYIQDGKFMRQFPVYDGDGKDAKPTGQKRLLQYGLRDNQFTVQTLSTDSTSNAKQAVSQPAKTTPTPKTAAKTIILPIQKAALHQITTVHLKRAVNHLLPHLQKRKNIRLKKRKQRIRKRRNIIIVMIIINLP